MPRFNFSVSLENDYPWAGGTPAALPHASLGVEAVNPLGLDLASSATESQKPHGLPHLNSPTEKRRLRITVRFVPVPLLRQTKKPGL